VLTWPGAGSVCLPASPERNSHACAVFSSCASMLPAYTSMAYLGAASSALPVDMKVEHAQLSILMWRCLCIVCVCMYMQSMCGKSSECAGVLFQSPALCISLQLPVQQPRSQPSCALYVIHVHHVPHLQLCAALSM
jgi:hypothetical protein